MVVLEDAEIQIRSMNTNLQLGYGGEDERQGKEIGETRGGRARGDRRQEGGGGESVGEGGYSLSDCACLHVCMLLCPLHCLIVWYVLSVYVCVLVHACAVCGTLS
jgi:hypothetical protein